MADILALSANKSVPHYTNINVPMNAQQEKGSVNSVAILNMLLLFYQLISVNFICNYFLIRLDTLMRKKSYLFIKKLSLLLPPWIY